MANQRQRGSTDSDTERPRSLRRGLGSTGELPVTTAERLRGTLRPLDAVRRLLRRLVELVLLAFDAVDAFTQGRRCLRGQAHLADILPGLTYQLDPDCLVSH